MFAADLKQGRITREQYDKAQEKLLTYHQTALNIKNFFDDDTVDFFEHFGYLGHILIVPYFSAREAYLILRFAIEKNYKAPNLDGSAVIDLTAIQNHRFKSVTKAELLSMFEKGRIQEIINGQVLNTKEEKLHVEINNVIEKFLVIPSDLVTKTRIAYNHLDKFESEEDIDKFIKCLKALYVPDGCCIKVRKYLESEVKKFKKKNEKVNESTEVFSPRREPVKKYLTENDVRNLRKSIKKYFNTYHLTIVKMPSYNELIESIKNLRILDELENVDIAKLIGDVVRYYITNKLLLASTYDEMIYLAGIMSYYKVEETTIYAFIKYTSENLKIEYQSTIEEYLSTIPKIEYLDPDMADILNEYYQEFADSDAESKNIILSTIREELDKVNNNKSYKYELSEARKRGVDWYND